MKKILSIVALLIAMIAFASVTSGCDKSKSQSDDQSNVTVEELIKEDSAFMDSIAKDVKFFECRITLNVPFNQADIFVPQEVVNVFQYETIDGKGDITPTVYFFIHELNCGTIIEKHEGAWIADDLPLHMDSIPITANRAFTVARQSNFLPSKSKCMTLRQPIGRAKTNPYWVIGNDSYGLLWVDAVTALIYDKNPVTTEK